MGLEIKELRVAPFKTIILDKPTLRFFAFLRRDLTSAGWVSCFLRKESLYQMTQSGLTALKLTLPPDCSGVLVPLQQQTTKVVTLAGVMDPDYHGRTRAGATQQGQAGCS